MFKAAKHKYGLVYFTRSTGNGDKYNKPLSGQHCFEPTLQSRSMIYTIHGFTAGVLTLGVLFESSEHRLSHSELWGAACELADSSK